MKTTIITKHSLCAAAKRGRITACAFGILMFVLGSFFAVVFAVVPPMYFSLTVPKMLFFALPSVLGIIMVIYSIKMLLSMRGESDTLQLIEQNQYYIREEAIIRKELVEEDECNTWILHFPSVSLRSSSLTTSVGDHFYLLFSQKDSSLLTYYSCKKYMLGEDVLPQLKS